MTPDLESIIGKALEKDRNLRYQHASDIRTDLQRLKRNEDTRSRPSRSMIAATATTLQAQSASSGAVSAATKKPRWLLLAGISALVIAALIGGGLYYRSTHDRRLTEKDTIVTADFDNKTRDAVFDGTLKTGLTWL